MHLKFVDPNDRTTLMLDFAWLPMHVITARAAFHHLIRDRVNCIDLNNGVFPSEAWLEGTPKIPKDNPAMRSANQAWPIPTVVVITEKFFRKMKKNASLKDYAKYHKNTCQICYNKFPLKDLTIEHCYPKSKGGINCTSNYTLSCKKCNSKKGSHFPYYDINGNEVKPSNIPTFFIPNEKDIRDEWEPFLIQKKERRGHSRGETNTSN